LNEKFLPVKFNAAATENVTFFGQVYKTGGQFAPHELTRAYMKQSFQMPAQLFINNQGQQVTELHGFIPPATLESILSFFVSDDFGKKTFDEFRKEYVNKIKY
jgi:thioredoxin-related protein